MICYTIETYSNAKCAILIFESEIQLRVLLLSFLFAVDESNHGHQVFVYGHGLCLRILYAFVNTHVSYNLLL